MPYDALWVLLVIALVAVIYATAIHYDDKRRRARLATTSESGDAPVAEEASPAPVPKAAEQAPEGHSSTPRSKLIARMRQRAQGNRCVVDGCPHPPLCRRPTVVEEQSAIAGLLRWAGAIATSRWRVDRDPVGIEPTLCVWHRDILVRLLEQALARLQASSADAEVQRALWLHEQVVYGAQEQVEASQEKLMRRESPTSIGTTLPRDLSHRAESRATEETAGES